MSQNRYWNLLAKKLSGEASVSELQELEQLLKENPEWHYPTDHINDVWSLSVPQKNAAKESYDSELAFEMHLEKMKKEGIVLDPGFPHTAADELIISRPKNRKPIYFALASLLVLSATAFFLLGSKPQKNSTAHIAKNSEISTRRHSKSRLVLPDSTVVWLNDGSKLTYNEQFGLSNRNTVLSGEAFFDVHHSSIPFIIHTNSIQIKVLGTAFNVKSYPNEKTETSLLRGRVEITIDKRPGEKFILKPNEKLVVAGEVSQGEAAKKPTEPVVVLGYLTHSTDSSIIETSWIDNRFVFQDETFYDIAKKMERWYDVDIKVGDEEIGRQRISGTFTSETVKEALEALQISTRFHFSIKGSLITITR